MIIAEYVHAAHAISLIACRNKNKQLMIIVKLLKQHVDQMQFESDENMLRVR